MFVGVECSNLPTRPGYADPLKAPRITQDVGVPQLSHTSYVWNFGDVVGAVFPQI